jgi:hypothetical protein
MSQQQLVPEPPQGQDVSGQSYRYKAARRSGDVLKEEHPATFEETVPPYGYSAQDRVPYNRGGNGRLGRRGWQRLHMDDDADAYETSYRPYRQDRHYGQVPPWIGSQRHRGVLLWRWLLVCVLALLAIKILPLIALAIIGVLSVLTFVLLLPFVILFAVLAVVLLIALLAVLSVRGFVRSLFGHRRRGGPWI